jgi:hypothetical protein
MTTCQSNKTRFELSYNHLDAAVKRLIMKNRNNMKKNAEENEERTHIPHEWTCFFNNLTKRIIE